jgi:manganese/zinc/iron transport system substrate-binding protein
MHFNRKKFWAGLQLLPFLLGIGLGLPLQSCSSEHDHENQRIEMRPYSGSYPIQIVTTTGMIADIAQNLGGKHVNVVSLMGEGVDPHLYKATPQDVKRLRSADLVLYNGLHLEGKMSDILVQLARQKPVFPVTENILINHESRLLEPEELAGMYDPHLWFDVELWSDCAAFTAELLKRLDPENEDDYTRNAQEYLKKLQDLHQYAGEELSKIVEERRVLVTAHDAFGYMGEAYNMKVMAIQGISTDSEAGVYKVNRLVDEIVTRRIGAVFIETSVSDKNIRALLEGCSAKNHQVVIGGELFSDAMGARGTPEGTYIGMVRHNIDTIVNALK